MPNPDRPTRIDETDAKAGSKEGVVRWVLLVSLGLTIAALTLIWVTGALTQGPVESQQNVERRIEAQREQAAENQRSDIDGTGLAEEGGMISPGTTERPEVPAARASGAAPNAD